MDRDPSGSRSAPWAKSGTVAGWEYFLAEEESNGWNGWFDGSEGALASASAVNAAGAYLEGALDLESLFGTVPDSILVAACAYESPDGGALSGQAPAGDASGSVEADEYVVLYLVGAGVPLEAEPARLALGAASPNPFRAASSLSFSLPSRSDVSVVVYDLRGRVVATLLEGERAAGAHEVRWGGRDDDGREVPSGIYFVRLRSARESATRKVVLLR